MSTPPEANEHSPSPPPLDELGQASTNTSQLDSGPDIRLQDILPGSVEPSPRFTRLGEFFVLILVIGVGAFLLLNGQQKRLGWLWPWSSTQTNRQLLDNHDGVVLLFEQDGADGRVLVQRSGQPDLMLISGTDLTASRPTLSPDGRLVAYHSQKQSAIVVTSLISPTQITIGTGHLVQTIRSTANLEYSICSWSKIVWDPASSRVAFFGCTTDEKRSVAFTSDALLPNSTGEDVPNSESLTLGERQLLWLDNSQLVLTWPKPDTGSLPSVITLPVK